MPQDQRIRNLVARMKLIPVHELIQGRRLLLCEDSIVRGTQLRETIDCLYDYGAKEVHMRPACPPLIYGCRFLNFSRSRSDFDLAGRSAIREIEGKEDTDLAEYAVPDSPKQHTMIDRIRTRLNLTTLRYQLLTDMVEAIDLPKEKVCTYCWDGAG
jgi:amidophosphoribosyltransferase